MAKQFRYIIQGDTGGERAARHQKHLLYRYAPLQNRNLAR